MLGEHHQVTLARLADHEGVEFTAGPRESPARR
jgi:hypothetical protein